jgi:hypothetical protein
MPWPDFRKAVFCLRRKRGPDGYFREKVKFKARLQMIYRLSDKGDVPLGSFMHPPRNCKCSDPRDRVYALLSIYHHDLNIVPDYRLSKEEVYQDFCLRHIASTKYENLDTIKSCEMHDSPSDLPSWVPDWSISNVPMPIKINFASGNSAADVQYLGGGVIRVMGVKVDTIVHANQIPVFDQSTGLTGQTIALIRRLAPSDLVLNLDMNGGEVFDTYHRTLCCDEFCDSFDPPAINLLSRNKSKEALRFFLTPERNLEPAKPLDPGFELYTNAARHCMKGRSFFSTDKGHIGLGPKLTNPEDEVVVFPGCDSPMVLRSTGDGRYKVVGECFIHHLSHSEALLGPIPKAYQKNHKRNDRTYQGEFVYYNHDTGQTHTIDPRLSLFRTELQEDGVRKIYVREPEIDGQSKKDERRAIRIRTSHNGPNSEIYTLMGIDIRPFDLV